MCFAQSLVSRLPGKFFCLQFLQRFIRMQKPDSNRFLQYKAGFYPCFALFQTQASGFGRSVLPSGDIPVIWKEAYCASLHDSSNHSGQSCTRAESKLQTLRSGFIVLLRTKEYRKSTGFLCLLYDRSSGIQNRTWQVFGCHAPDTGRFFQWYERRTPASGIIMPKVRIL